MLCQNHRVVDLSYVRVCQALGVHKEMASFEAQWNSAAASFNPDGDWLPSPSTAADFCRWMGMEEAVAQVVIDGVAEVCAHPALVMLSWQYYVALFAPTAIRPLPQVAWFNLPEALGHAGRMFQAAVILSGLPRFRHEHGQRGIPEIITRSTLEGLELWMRNYRERFGQWGFDRGSWLMHHLCSRLVRLERLEFGLSFFNFDFTYFRQRAGARQVLALADSGLLLREDGRFHSAQGTASTDHAWETELRCDDQAIEGYPVLDCNVVARHPVSLDPSEWEVVLRAGDPVLDIHIPSRGRLEPAACDDSIARALAFFPRYFPEHSFKAFTCGSWLLDPQFAQHLPGSNIAAFAQRFHRLPAPEANDNQIYVLGLGLSGRRPLEELPRDTSLRRALVAHLEKGGHWWYTNGIVLREAGGDGQK